MPPGTGRLIRRSLFLLLCIGLGIFFGIGGYTFYYAEGGSYFSDDPKACVNCHIMRDAYDSWQKSSHHAAATCNDCHVPHDFVGKYWSKMTNGYHHSTAFTFQNYPDVVRIKPKNAQLLHRNCVECHRDLVDAVVHGGAGETGSCVDCHPSAGHGPRR